MAFIKMTAPSRVIPRLSWIKCVSNFDLNLFFGSHNPKNNTFTSVYYTPLSLNARKFPEAVGGVSYFIFHFKIAFKEDPWAKVPVRFLSVSVCMWICSVPLHTLAQCISITNVLFVHCSVRVLDNLVWIFVFLDPGVFFGSDKQWMT